MAVLVSYMPADYVGSKSNLAVSTPRHYESVATGAVTSEAALDGEWALVVSNEALVVKGASGTTPDASVSTATAATSAAFAIPPNIPLVVRMHAGEKLSFEAV